MNQREPYVYMDLPTIQAQAIVPQEWVVDKLVPFPGITVIHGRWGSGKTPLMVTESLCVAQGLDFLGHKTYKGPVLIIEGDMLCQHFINRFLPPIKVADPTVADIRFLYPRRFDVLDPMIRSKDVGKKLLELEAELQPRLVLVDSLRRFHTRDERESSSSADVYDAWMDLFPNSAIQFVAHNRKQQIGKNGGGPSSEDFSGHQGWLNDAQSALHINCTSKEQAQVKTFRIEHTKSQVGELAGTIEAVMTGGAWISRQDEGMKDKIVKDVLEDPQFKNKNLTGPGGIDEEIGKRLGKGERTGRKVRTTYEAKISSVSTEQTQGEDE